MGSVFVDAHYLMDLNSHYLMRLRKKAMRRHIWFRALSRVERGIVNLTIKIVNRPKSLILIMALARIVVKINMALRNPIIQLIEQVGRPLAKKISIIALRWGNKEAEKWAEDKRFIKYLTVTDINNIPGFRLSNTLLAK